MYFTQTANVINAESYERYTKLANKYIKQD